MDTKKKSPSSQAKKRPYETTRLRVYGTVGELTKAVGNSGPNDGGMVTDMTMSRL